MLNMGFVDDVELILGMDLLFTMFAPVIYPLDFICCKSDFYDTLNIVRCCVRSANSVG